MCGLRLFLGVDEASVELGNKEGPGGKVWGVGVGREEVQLAALPLLGVIPHALEGEMDLLFLCHVVECEVVVALVNEAFGLEGLAVEHGGEVGFDMDLCCWGCSWCWSCRLDVDDGGWCLYSSDEGLELGQCEGGVACQWGWWGVAVAGAVVVVVVV